MQNTTPPPTTLGRVRHQPTPRDPSLPPTMRVAVELGFVQTCPDCRRIASEFAASCVSDATVTGFRLVPGRKHAHEVTEGTSALPGLTAVPIQGVSDTNGDDPDAVHAALFADDPLLNAPASSGLNGFDHEGRV